MIDFNKYKLSFEDAKSVIDKYDCMSDSDFKDQALRWSSFNVPEENYGFIYKDIRSTVVNEFKQALYDNNNRIDYNLDLRVGIKLYEVLNTKNGFDIIKANDDDIWRYISVCVMPDITFIRYPNLPNDVDTIREKIPNLTYPISITTEKDSKRIKKKRFYSHTRRIWLKTLWWYIHLGWQGDSETTYNTLKNNGTNIISHFIERPGKGYREKLFRSMLRAYSKLPEQKDSIFRAAAKLNLAKCVSVEPSLTVGGETTYSDQLFKEVLAVEEGNKDVEK